MQNPQQNNTLQPNQQVQPNLAPPQYSQYPTNPELQPAYLGPPPQYAQPLTNPGPTYNPQPGQPNLAPQQIPMQQPMQQPIQMQQPTYPPLYIPKSVSPGYVPLQVAPPPKPKKSGGLFANLSKQIESGLNSVTHDLEKIVAVHVTTDHYANERFRRNFNLPMHEGLYGEFPCKAATFDTVLPGNLYLSYSYLSFYTEFQGRKAIEMIPLRNIISINRMMIGKSAKQSQPNIVQYNTYENKMQENYVIEVYTDIGHIHHFYSFHNYENAFNQFNYAVQHCNRNILPPQPVMYQQQVQPTVILQNAPQPLYVQPQPVVQPKPSLYPQSRQK